MSTNKPPQQTKTPTSIKTQPQANHKIHPKPKKQTLNTPKNKKIKSKQYHKQSTQITELKKHIIKYINHNNPSKQDNQTTQQPQRK